MTLSQEKVLIRGHWPTHGYRLLDWAAILIGWGKSPIKGRGCDHSNVYGEMSCVGWKLSSCQWRCPHVSFLVSIQVYSKESYPVSGLLCHQHIQLFIVKKKRGINRELLGITLRYKSNRIAAKLTFLMTDRNRKSSFNHFRFAAQRQ